MDQPTLVLRAYYLQDSIFDIYIQPIQPIKVTEHLWVLILPFFIGFHESIRLVLLSDQVWTKNVENSQSYLIKYISLQ
jgi:hypothetical protein